MKQNILKVIVNEINTYYLLRATLKDNTIIISHVCELESDDPDFIREEIRSMLEEVINELGHRLICYVVNPVAKSCYDVKITDDELNEIEFELKIEWEEIK